eukprot:3834304-Amphidinium_carterae.1
MKGRYTTTLAGCSNMTALLGTPAYEWASGSTALQDRGGNTPSTTIRSNPNQSQQSHVPFLIVKKGVVLGGNSA